MVPLLLSMLTLVFAVMSILYVGRATTEKVRMQDALDAAALAGAVWEARALNFAAYANRAMIAHLVTITQLTSLHSHAQFTEEFLEWLSRGAVLIPTLGPIASRLLSVSGKAYRQVALQANRAGVPAAQFMNDRLSQAQALMLRAVQAGLPHIVGQVLAENDPALRLDPAALARVARDTRALGRAVSRGSPEELQGVTWETLDDFSRRRAWRTPRVGLLPYLEKDGGSALTAQEIRAWDHLFLWHPGWSRLKLRWQRTPLIQKEARATAFGYRGIPTFLTLAEPMRDRPSVTLAASRALEHVVQLNATGWEIPGLRGRRAVVQARAEVVYRRPDRDEPPNLYNPFWEARLAPIARPRIPRPTQAGGAR
ncbi:MAG: hypothetical protein HYV08_16685 [Deltaproteobacteria bacterium]|nr:hypothetical protein [Deltaproteobacteria bacterium]MBI3075395.1 hypothetical protein [Deltaproteobacteria bacterium]